MKNINVSILEGYVGKVDQLGPSFWRFSVCVSTIAKGKDGSWSETPNWLTCTIGGERGKRLVESGGLAKGSRVVVRSHVVVSNWCDKDGGKHRDVEFRADEVACIKPAAA